MKYCNKSVLLPYLQDVCTLIAAERRLRQKVANINLSVFFGHVLAVLSCACFAWCVWYAIDYVQDFNAYLEWAYDSSSWDYWMKESDQFLPDAVGAMIILAFSVIAFVCGILITRRKRSIEELEHELNWLSSLLGRAVDVDLIPLQYRTPRCFFYLYNWFNASTTDDLSIALNTIMHEDGERLEHLVSDQGKVLLKQWTSLVAQMQTAPSGNGAVDEIRAQLNVYLSGPNNL